MYACMHIYPYIPHFFYSLFSSIIIIDNYIDIQKIYAHCKTRQALFVCQIYLQDGFKFCVFSSLTSLVFLVLDHVEQLYY